MRFRITVRSETTELRGYTEVDSAEHLTEFAQNMAPVGVVIASGMHEEFDWRTVPSPESSLELVKYYIDQGFIEELAQIHFMQAMVIRGERDGRESAEAQLQERELHHFEVEQENEQLRARMEIPSGG